MPIGIGEDHEELRRTVRRWLEARCPPEVPRALLDAETETMPPFWDELAGQGWLGIHVAEEHGGQGFGMLELAVVVEEMARAVMPGPALPTMLAAAVRGRRRRRRPAQGAARPDGRRHAPHRRGPAGRRRPRGAARRRRLTRGPRGAGPRARRHAGPPAAGPGGSSCDPVDPDGGNPGGDSVWCVIDLDGAGVTPSPAGEPRPDPTGRHA